MSKKHWNGDILVTFTFRVSKMPVEKTVTYED